MLKAADLKITFDLDEFTWGDLEDLKNGWSGLLKVCGRIGQIEGVEPDEVESVLRQLSARDIKDIDRMMSDALENFMNPKDETGKN